MLLYRLIHNFELILSVSVALLIGFTILSIFYFHDYYEITKEIYKIELDYSFTSLFSSMVDGLKDRPDTSGLQAEADVSLTLGIIFTAIACIALGLFIVFITKMIKAKKSEQ